MIQINANKLGLSLGIFLALVHLLWALLILIGVAQPLMDFLMALHMMESEALVKVAEFSFMQAGGLVLVAAVCGYVMGFVFAVIWNMLQKKASE